MPFQGKLYPWTKSANIYSRSLSASETVLTLINDYAFGHNCPYLGITVSLQDDSGAPKSLTVKEVQERVVAAFVHTRWVYPLVASRIEDAKRLAYQVEDAKGIADWAARTVHARSTKCGSWVELHDELSRNTLLPSPDGDCTFLYLVLKSGQTAESKITKFDLVLHAHHGLTDSSGFRSILNEIMKGLAIGKKISSYAWGDELDRLSPAAVDISLLSDATLKTLSQLPKEIPLPPLEKLEAQGDRPGTGVASHTFESKEILDCLLKVARNHKVKLTAVVQTALIFAIHEAIKDGPSPPQSNDKCTVLSGFNLRTRGMAEPWKARNHYVGAGVGLEMMEIPVSLLLSPDSWETRFWSVAEYVHQAWVGVSQRTDVGAAGELRRAGTGFIINTVLAEATKPSSDLTLNLNYVSDPAGTQQLDGLYKRNDGSGIKFNLEHYQIVSDESTPKLSCRSHSWNGLLTLFISFNNGRHSQAKIDGIMQSWTQNIGQILEQQQARAQYRPKL